MKDEQYFYRKVVTQFFYLHMKTNPITLTSQDYSLAMHVSCKCIEFSHLRSQQAKEENPTNMFLLHESII